MTYALVLLSYLLGATPTSYWMAKALHGIDLRDHGSCNLGATNAFRVLGWKSALPVVLLDVAKGYVAVGLFPGMADAGFAWSLAFGAAAIAGHMFSFWVGFRGGKGIATSVGVFLAVAPLAVLGSFVVWVAVVIPSRYVSLGSIAGALTLPVFIAITPHPERAGLVAFSTALAAFIIWAHRSNIRRLTRGQESRFGRGGAAAPDTSGAAPEPTPEQADA